MILKEESDYRKNVFIYIMKEKVLSTDPEYIVSK